MIHHHGSIDQEERSKTRRGSSSEVAGIAVGGRVYFAAIRASPIGLIRCESVKEEAGGRKRRRRRVGLGGRSRRWVAGGWLSDRVGWVSRDASVSLEFFGIIRKNEAISYFFFLFIEKYQTSNIHNFFIRTPISMIRSPTNSYRRALQLS